MKLLVDSHVFLWMLVDPEQIGTLAQQAISEADRVSVSTASLWELALKFTKGRLAHPPAELAAGVSALHLHELAIEHRHLAMLPTVVLPQGDPFDTLLAAQTLADDLCLVTADRLLLASSVTTLDARRRS